MPTVIGTLNSTEMAVKLRDSRDTSKAPSTTRKLPSAPLRSPPSGAPNPDLLADIQNLAYEIQCDINNLIAFLRNGSNLIPLQHSEQDNRRRRKRRNHRALRTWLKSMGTITEASTWTSRLCDQEPVDKVRLTARISVAKATSSRATCRSSTLTSTAPSAVARHCAYPKPQGMNCPYAKPCGSERISTRRSSWALRSPKLCCTLCRASLASGMCG